jgi:hypothetical protein
MLERPKPKEVVGNEAEVMALRTIVINLAMAEAQGQPMAQEKIQELIDYADRERFRRREERIGEAAKRRKQRSEKASGDGQR